GLRCANPTYRCCISCGLMIPRILRASVRHRKLTSVMQHGTNAFALVEQVEGFVDFFERHVVGDELIDLDLTAHVLFHVTRKLAATFHAAERRALPDPAGNQLERTGGDFLAGAR